MDNETYLKGLRTGDDSVIRQIFAHFKAPVVGLLLKKSATYVQAEDVFMDALEAIYRKVRKEELVLRDCSFQTYLTTVCLNQWYNKCRRKKFSAAITPEELTALQNNDRLEEELLRTERENLFWNVLSTMGETCRLILQLAMVERKPLTAVGEQLGYTYDYARKKKSQCQRKLVRLIKEDDRFQELKS